MKRLLFILLILPTIASAQSWEWAKGVANNEDGNYCTVDNNGYVYVTGGLGVNVNKYDSASNLLWSISATGGNSKGVMGITTDLFGNEYIVGTYDTTFTFAGHVLTSPGPRQFYIFIAKITSAGSVEWIKPVGDIWSSPGYGSTSWISTDTLGRIYITCSFTNNPTIGGISLTNANTDNSPDILVAKFDSSGSVIWAKNFSGRGSEFPFGISVTSSGYIYIDGYFIPSDTLTFGSTSLIDTVYFQGFLAKLDSNGNPIWARGLNGALLTGLATNSNDEVFVTGGYAFQSLTLGSYVLPYPATVYFYGLLAKYDSSGNVSWAKCMNGNYVEANSATVDPCGNVWIFSQMGINRLTLNDTVDGHILTPTTINGNPSFIAGWSNSGVFIDAIAMPAGSGDFGTIAADKCGNLYISGVQEGCDTMMLANDTSIVSSSTEKQFIAKYVPNLGCGHCSESLNVNIDQQDNIAIYPNPAHSTLTVSGSKPISTVSIINLFGQTFYTNYYHNELVQIDISSLPNGVYIVKINGSEIRKFVKK